MISGTPAPRSSSSKVYTPKIVQELLGHAAIAKTLDTYSHALANLQSEVVLAMQEALS